MLFGGFKLQVFFYAPNTWALEATFGLLQ